MKFTSPKWLTPSLHLLAPCLTLVLLTSLHAQDATPAPSAPPAISPVWRDPNAPIEKRLDDLLGKMTLDEKLTIIAGSDKIMGLLPLPRLGIPEIKMTDGPMGDRVYGKAAAYANGLGLASTWNVDQALRAGIAQCREARARGVAIILAPAMDLYRAPMCGRNFEYLGEDSHPRREYRLRLHQGCASQRRGRDGKTFRR